MAGILWRELGSVNTICEFINYGELGGAVSALAQEIPHCAPIRCRATTPKSKCAEVLPAAIFRGAETFGAPRIVDCACARFRNAHFAAGARSLSPHSPRKAKCHDAFCIALRLRVALRRWQRHSRAPSSSAQCCRERERPNQNYRWNQTAPHVLVLSRKTHHVLRTLQAFFRPGPRTEMRDLTPPEKNFFVTPDPPGESIIG